MLEELRSADWRGAPRKMSSIGVAVPSNIPNSACSTIPRLNSARAGFPCGSVARIVSSISSPGWIGPFWAALRLVFSEICSGRSIVKGLVVSW